MIQFPSALPLLSTSGFDGFGVHGRPWVRTCHRRDSRACISNFGNDHAECITLEMFSINRILPCYISAVDYLTLCPFSMWQTLSDFQYIDSGGRDQGSNVRKKSQSLVALVNDKERIAEVREKASANRDK